MPNSRDLENNLVRIVAVIGFLIIAYFGIQIGAGLYSQKLIKAYSGPAEELKNSFRAEISEQTDAYGAAKMGTQFAQAQNNDLASLAFQKATDLDPEYRDGWVGRGQAELQNNQPEEALESLKRAEEIDPINPRTYELLAIAYRATDDEEAAKKAEEKWKYLNETQ